MGSSADSKKSSPERFRIERGSAWAGAWKITAALAVLGFVLSGLAQQSDPHRFAFSWLYAFMATLAIGLGSLFFVIVQHMSGAGWSVAWRRIPEIMTQGLWIIPVLALPVFLQAGELYPWTQLEGAQTHADVGVVSSVAHAQDHAAEHGAEHSEHGSAEHGHSAHHTPQHALHEETIAAKVAFLNTGRFWGFGIFYLVVWAGLAYFFSMTSLRQDVKKDVASTLRMQRFAPLATIAFGLTLTFAAFDWMMSLEPAWYSTIFGVQYFAVSAVSSLAAIITIAYSLRSSGLIGDSIQVEHFHDLGKLLFGFMVFWAYITFSQFMLIWYASIPEETTYYHARWAGGWQSFTLALAVGHFIAPFFFLISRNVKRRIPLLAFGAGWLLVMHVLECFWLVMPYASEDGAFQPHWMDIATVFATAGTFLTLVFWRLTQVPLLPIGDPRLERSLHHEVV